MPCPTGHRDMKRDDLPGRPVKTMLVEQCAGASMAALHAFFPLRLDIFAMTLLELCPGTSAASLTSPP